MTIIPVLPSFRLSKTTYLQGRQCPLRLWLRARGVRERPVDATPDAVDDFSEQATMVEEVAQRRFPGGVCLGGLTAVPETGPPTFDPMMLDPHVSAVFQAPYKTSDLVGRTDILARTAAGWILYEIKSSTRWKPIFIWDLAFQWLLVEACGQRVVAARVLHLDKNYLRGEGDIGPDAQSLLVEVDCTREVRDLLDEVRAEIKQLLAAVQSVAPPEIRPGRHCSGNRDDPAGRRPSDCGYLEPEGYCGKQLPENWSLRLPRASGSTLEFVARGGNNRIEALDPNDEQVDWTELQQRVIRSVHSGQPFVDREFLRDELSKLAHPVSYMDFEFEPACAVPPFAGMRPNQKLPFQWSMRIQKSPGAPLSAVPPFLHLTDSDPRGEFVEALLAALPDSGSIVVHSSGAEASVLNLYAEWLGGRFGSACKSVTDRMFDTCELSRKGYYHPKMQCSFSIKRLGPALIDRGYDHLSIQDGMEAVRRWRQMIRPETSEEEKRRVREDLIAYCDQDTVLMHAIIERFRELVN